MCGKNNVTRAWVALSISTYLAWISGCAVPETYVSPAAVAGGPIVMRTASAQETDPFLAGQRAAQTLQEQMRPAAPHTVILTECFEGRAQKAKALKGVCSVFEKDIIFGFSTYGSFDQQGCLDDRSIALLGIAGEGIATAAVLRRDLGIAGLTVEKDEDELARRLGSAGGELATALAQNPNGRLLVLMADAHSPKNQFLVAGAQEVMGEQFPMTGGSANKNAGQTFVYFQGRVHTDSAVGLLLSGDFEVSLTGKKAQENRKVISSAAEGAAEALKKAPATPFSVLAFNCAGRKGKLDNIEDELQAIQGVLGTDIPLFGAYCAGEIGPADVAEEAPTPLSSGVGWHVMFTVLSR